MVPYSELGSVSNKTDSFFKWVSPLFRSIKIDEEMLGSVVDVWGKGARRQGKFLPCTP